MYEENIYGRCIFDAMGAYSIAGFSMMGFGMAAYHTTHIYLAITGLY